MTSAAPDFHIRLLRPSELPTVLKLLEEADMYTTSVTLEDGPGYYARYGLGELGGEAVGVMGLEQTALAGPAGATLMRSFTVRAGQRGRGLSREFLRWAAEEAAAQGHSQLFLFSEADSDIAAYWEHQGFKRVSPAHLAAKAPALPQVQDAIKTGWLEDAYAWERTL